jgi:hypothetical protein
MAGWAVILPPKNDPADDEDEAIEQPARLR